ncbi:TrmB family transcriptional regulator sugar-binding domain-containing protein [Okeania sp. SIO2B3]|uniref:TrmB family transcriptional regulator sugar-binding domain-containing protein n=1 Tax=Okeania sp. SIO2B3 TaxID=2607784 RepID=UPI0013BF5504|nr:TrmB family transcriptional regulator sugar-binding domain-containing protein [Okeania sp. SIO2B3]NET44128.1 hypothetical protein [Okeania sp. SIO2B3]
MKIIKDILDDIKKGENIDGYLALILGLICSFIGIFDVSQDYVLTAISTVLTFLALGILIDRKNTQKVSKLLEGLTIKQNDILAQRNKAFFYNNILESISNAKEEICILVRSGSTLKSFDEEIKKAIMRNCQVRIILCARNPETINSMAFRGHKTNNPNKIFSDIENSINNLTSLKEKINESQIYLLKIREIQYLPSIGFSISDPESSDGKLFALLASFRSESSVAPSILLNKKNDIDLFNYFKQEFDNYWEAANEITELT